MRGTFITAATIALTVGTGVGMAAAADATEIEFPAGGTSSTVAGDLAEDGKKSYTFDARAGQTATVEFIHSSANARWTLVGPEGTPLHTGMTEQQGNVTVQLPNTGTYEIDVETDDSSSYQLTLTIDSSSGSSQVSQVPTGAADTGGGATGGIEDAGLLGAGAVVLTAAGGFGAVAARRRRTDAARPDALPTY